MKRYVEIEKSFEAIRRMPTEISFQSVQQLVMSHPAIPLKNHFDWLNLKNFLTMIVITSVLSLVLIFNRPAHQSLPVVSNEIQKPTQLPTPGLKAEIPLAKKGEPLLITAETKKRTEAPLSSLPERQKPIASLEMESSEILPPAHQEYPLINWQQKCAEETDSVGRVRATSGCKCNCNFGDDDGWIEDVVEELLRERLIENECIYRFRLSQDEVSVNGKEITDKQFAEKLRHLFESATRSKLINDSYVKLEVNNESCSLSKNINN